MLTCSVFCACGRKKLGSQTGRYPNRLHRAFPWSHGQAQASLRIVIAELGRFQTITYENHNRHQSGVNGRQAGSGDEPACKRRSAEQTGGDAKALSVASASSMAQLHWNDEFSYRQQPALRDLSPAVPVSLDARLRCRGLNVPDNRGVRVWYSGIKRSQCARRPAGQHRLFKLQGHDQGDGWRGAGRAIRADLGGNADAHIWHEAKAECEPPNMMEVAGLEPATSGFIVVLIEGHYGDRRSTS